jgi:hypothetical protein
MTTSLPTDTAYKAVEYNKTYTGRMFYPLRPDPAVVSIIDIAHHLSQQCRYAGATQSPPGCLYSTAQHCVLLADYATQILKASALDCLQILIHDGAEAYLTDIPRPVKQFLPEYRAWEHRVQMVIREWLSMRDVPIPPFQDEIDSRIITDEHDQLFIDQETPLGHDVHPLGIFIEPWTSRYAERQFLIRYATLSHAVFGAHQYLDRDWGLPMNTVYSTHSDVVYQSPDEPPTMNPNPELITDLVQVDLRGGVGLVAMRGHDGIMIRDTKAGSFPRPAYKFIHGRFDLTTTMWSARHELGGR